MTFVVQVQVEAENVQDALTKIGSGNVISVNPRPQQPQTAVRGYSSTSGPVQGAVPQTNG